MFQKGANLAAMLVVSRYNYLVFTNLIRQHSSAVYVGVVVVVCML